MADCTVSRRKAAELAQAWLALYTELAHNRLLGPSPSVPVRLEQRFQRLTRLLAAAAEERGLSTTDLFHLISNLQGADDAVWDAAHALVHRLQCRCRSESPRPWMRQQLELLMARVPTIRSGRDLPAVMVLADEIDMTAEQIGFSHGPVEFFSSEDGEAQTSTSGIRLYPPSGREPVLVWTVRSSRWIAEEQRTQHQDQGLSDEERTRMTAVLAQWCQALDRQPADETVTGKRDGPHAEDRPPAAGPKRRPRMNKAQRKIYLEQHVSPRLLAYLKQIGQPLKELLKKPRPIDKNDPERRELVSLQVVIQRTDLKRNDIINCTAWKRVQRLLAGP